MSTRASIIIKDIDNKRIHIYHHYDGYPSGVGSDLLQLLKQYRESSHRIWWYGSQMANDLIKNPTVKSYEMEYDRLDCQWYEKKDEAGNKIVKESIDDNYEVDFDVHGDIEYLYVINCKFKTIRCFRRPFGMDNPYDCIKREYLVNIPENDFTKID